MKLGNIMTFLKDKVFTFLKEVNIYAKVRDRFIQLLKKEKEPMKAFIKEYLKEKSPIVKNALVGFIMDNIQLPFPFKMFKGTIKKTIEKNFDKLIELALIKLQEV